MNNKSKCSSCKNYNTTLPGTLGTVFCFDCSGVTEIKTGKKVYKSYPHPNKPYNYSEDELFLVLCFGGLVVTAAGKPDHLGKIYKWLSGENDDFFNGGLGLNKQESQQIHNRLLDGDDTAIEISKKLTDDEKSNLFNLLYLMLINQKDTTIEEAAALVEICRTTDSNWTSFFIYLTENTPFKVEDLGPVLQNIKLPLLNFKKKGDKFMDSHTQILHDLKVSKSKKAVKKNTKSKEESKLKVSKKVPNNTNKEKSAVDEVTDKGNRDSKAIADDPIMDSNKKLTPKNNSLNYILKRKKNLTLSIILILFFKLLIHFFIYTNMIRRPNCTGYCLDEAPLNFYIDNIFIEKLWLFIPSTILVMFIAWYLSDKIKVK